LFRLGLARSAFETVVNRQLSLFGEPAARSPRGQVGPVAVDDDLRRLAAALPASIRIGTSSWSFSGWEGIIYDRRASEAVLARRGLAAYAQHPLLRMVGIDRSYYRPLDRATFAEYAAAVPEDFRFLVKACEQCTVARYPRHPRYGDQGGRINPLYLDAGFTADIVVAPMVEGLGDKAGPLVFQFPPQHRAAMGGADFAEVLHTFLGALPRGPVYAVEIRDAALLTPEYGHALRAAGAVHCYNVHPKMPGMTVQHQVVGDQDQVVARWMLGHEQDYEEARSRYAPFDHIVDPDPGARRHIAQLCLDARRRGRGASVTINNKAEGSAPLSARALAEEIVAAAN